MIAEATDDPLPINVALRAIVRELQRWKRNSARNRTDAPFLGHQSVRNIHFPRGSRADSLSHSDPGLRRSYACRAFLLDRQQVADLR